MTASLSGVWNAQEFTDAGAPLVSGRLYTYSVGTTTHKTAYTDQAGTIPHTYTSDGMGGQYIALDARGELPAPLWLSASGYDLTLKRSDGTLVWTRRAVGTADAANTLDTALRADLASQTSDKGASLVGYLPSWGSGRNTDDKLREVKSLLDGASTALKAAVASGTYTDDLRTEMLTTAQAAWTAALAGGYDIYAPGGTYQIGDANWPWRNPVSTSLLDCKNITIFGEGAATVFSTYSSDGADCFQINAVKNLHFRNLRIAPILTAFGGSGSNAISVTNGWDNLTLDGVLIENAPGVDKGAFIDGGKALSIQPGTTSNACGRLRARYEAKGCAEAFGMDADLVTMAGKAATIELDYSAEDCYRALKFSAAGATGALTTAMTSGITAKVKATNCQQDIALFRCHGIRVECQVITNKTAADRRLSPTGASWIATDTIVEAFHSEYSKNARIRITGNKGACDYKARIGGASAGSSGLNGATEYADISLDIGGTASSADVLEINSGGNTMRNSRLDVSAVTATSLPTAFHSAALLNSQKIGSVYTGSYTATLTGVSDATPPTGTVEYSISGDQVTLEIPAITGTSNTTSATLTGAPDALKPAAAQSCIGITTNNGVTAIAMVQMSTAGNLVLTVGVSSTGFTAAGTKGSAAMTITYRRS